MNTAVRAVYLAARRLSSAEQRELIGELSASLQPPISDEASQLGQTPPVTDLAALKADFWPTDETADDINAFVAQQRAEDLHSAR
ncbi:MAG TPA: hypothetical protein VIL85_22660 [Thermomicrobiales bacterium]|jgi:hypothetical protein